MWSPPAAGGEVLLDSEFYECASRQAAHELVARLRGEFQAPMPALQQRTTVGDVAFGSPNATTLLFARGNLVLLLRNAGRELVSVEDFAGQFDRVIAARPEMSAEQTAAEVRRFQFPKEEISAGCTMSLQLDGLPRAEQLIWYKIFASTGEIRSEDGRLLFTPVSNESQEITVHAVRYG